MSVISTSSTITLNFSLSLEDGQLIDSTFERPTPAVFTMGDGKLLPGFEKKLLGLGAGQRERFTILPEDAFGMPNPNNLQEFERKQFDGMELAEGLVISFADAAGGELPGVVSQITTERVVVDFNHPLAGRTLIFDVDILAVETH